LWQSICIFFLESVTPVIFGERMATRRLRDEMNVSPRDLMGAVGLLLEKDLKRLLEII